MNKNQRIKDHYNFSGEYKIYRPRKGNSWSASRYTQLKKQIKFHYSVVQDDICPYCREEIRYGGYGEPIEHIYPKSDEPSWMFEPRNLCLSCYGCNSKKHNKTTTINGYVKSQNYPNESELFRIVHPHLDKYSKHIDSNNIFLRPRANSEKGRETIRICQLNRMDLLIKRAKRNSQSKKAMIDFNIDQLCSSYSTNEERKQAAIFIQDLIERAKHLKNIKKAN
tara:strand:- start:575 stop:1243 length:669 start_codon:yes stop_codon:yes gene_type:complete